MWVGRQGAALLATCGRLRVDGALDAEPMKSRVMLDFGVEVKRGEDEACHHPLFRLVNISTSQWAKAYASLATLAQMCCSGLSAPSTSWRGRRR